MSDLHTIIVCRFLSFFLLHISVIQSVLLPCPSVNKGLYIQTDLSEALFEVGKLDFFRDKIGVTILTFMALKTITHRYIHAPCHKSDSI